MRQVFAASKTGDIIWEPFGGLATASVASVLLGRRPYAAELDDRFAEMARKRLDEAVLYVVTNGLIKEID